MHRAGHSERLRERGSEWPFPKGEHMEAVLLVLMAAVLILFTGRGWWRGFLRTALGMVAVILAVAAGVLLSPGVSRFLRTSTPLYETVRGAVAETVADALEPEEGEAWEDAETALENSSLPGVLKETLLENNKEEVYRLLGVDSFPEYVSGYLAGVIVQICGVLLTFVLVFVGIRLAFLLLGIVGNLPGIHFFNKVGGGLLGFLQGLVVIWILCFVITIFSSTQWGQEALRAIEGNAFLSLIYDGALSLGNVLTWGKNLL